jgi:hypothetical protein
VSVELIVGDALRTISHDAVIFHCGVRELVEAGWSSAATPLLRTMLDLYVSALAVVHGSNRVLNAFRYFNSGVRRLSRYDKWVDKKPRAELREQLCSQSAVLPPEQRAAAAQFLREADRNYWYSEEWSGPKDVLRRYGPEGSDLSYQTLSAAAHGGYFGLRLFQDSADVHSINPRLPVGPSALTLLLYSATVLTDISEVRGKAEGLDTSSCAQFRETVRALKHRFDREYTFND